LQVPIDPDEIIEWQHLSKLTDLKISIDDLGHAKALNSLLNLSHVIQRVNIEDNRNTIKKKFIRWFKRFREKNIWINDRLITKDPLCLTLLEK